MSTTPAVPDDAVRTFVADRRARFLADLAEWLRIPSVSADPGRAGDVRRSAEWLAGKLRGTGFPVTEIWETDGAPAVFAEWPSGEPDAPTVLVYGHHDVQPASREDGWDSDPFEPVERDGRLYARGAADDKGQVFFHTLGVRAHLAATGRSAPAVNLKLLVEGEEESGSPHFPALVRERAARLACDAAIVSDTGMWAGDTPTVCTGMRGLTDCQIDLEGPDQDIHSGSFGGAVPNPATEAARLAASLHDTDRRVTLPGFYDGVVELTPRERELFAELPFDEEAWLATAHSRAALGERGYTTLERVWARPTAEVNGISGGYQGPGGKTIVPSTAQLKLSFRLVAGQDAGAVQQSVRDWVAASLPEGIRHRVTFWGSTRPCLTPLDHPALASVVRSMEKAFGTKVRFTREGGSGPAADLQDVLDVPVLFLGISIPSDGWHAPNEKVELDLLLKGVETAAYLWDDLAEHWPRSVHAPAAGGHISPSSSSPGEQEAEVTLTTGSAGTGSAETGAAGRPIMLTPTGGIDRAAHHRMDEAWLAAAWSHPTTRVFVVSGGQALVEDHGDRTELVKMASFDAPFTEEHRYFLGIDGDGVRYFALQKDSLPGRMDDVARPAGLREAGLLLSDLDAELMAHAVGLENWQRTHRFCSRCGEHTVIAAAGHVRRCQACGAEHYPRTDPAVIMLVTDEYDRALLGRQVHWPEGRFSTLAGFVEPGESLEAAVAREVAEEAGVTVGKSTYFGSQPWPFPASLMLGFTARATSPDIQVDGEEIEEARWFSRADLKAGIESGEVLPPSGISIAARLVENWYGEPLPRPRV